MPTSLCQPHEQGKLRSLETSAPCDSASPFVAGISSVTVLRLLSGLISNCSSDTVPAILLLLKRVPEGPVEIQPSELYPCVVG